MSRLHALTQRLQLSDAAEGRVGTIELNFLLAQLVGIPLTGFRPETCSQKRVAAIFGGTVLVLLFCYVGLELYDLTLSWHDLDMLTQNLSMTFTHTAYFFKVCNTLLHQTDLRWVAKQFCLMTKMYVRSPKQLLLFHKVEMQNKVVMVLYLAMVAVPTVPGMFLVLIVPENLAGKSFPYHVQMPSFLPPILQHLYMGFSIIYVSFAITMIDYINVLMINQICMHLKMISLALEDLAIKNSSKRQHRLSDTQLLIKIVQYHDMLIRVRFGVEQIFRLPVMAQFISSLLIIAVTLFQAIVGDRGQSNSSVLIYIMLIEVLLQLFLYCWCGNEVMEQSRTLCLSGFFSDWHKKDIKFRKILLIFMINSQRPFVFTAGGFMQLSLQSFTNILGKSYSFVAILRQMYKG